MELSNKVPVYTQSPLQTSLATKGPFVIQGKGLTIENIVEVARYGRKVELHPESIQKIKACREMLERKLKNNETMYGINTGIGEFSETKLTEQEISEFQVHLVHNHAAGIGKPAPKEHVRAAMLARCNVLAHGNSACRLEIVETFVELLNKDVTPLVCEKGSVGACGDLAPMSQIALLLLGEGEAEYQGKHMSGKEAMEKAGIKAPGLKPRDGLAAINGSNFLTGMSALMCHDTERILKHAEIACAMSLEALKANFGPYHPKLHEARGFKGSMRCAATIRKLTEGGDLQLKKIPCKVQDAYSMRSTPQVIGAAWDALGYAKSQVEIELNGVGDNPIFFAEDNLQLSGANFQGSPVAVPMDMVGYCITMICVLSERRMNRLTNPALSVGLPPFLTKHPGMYSGLMLSQYTADMQITEQKILSSPACIQSIPAAADQEDFVSMGMNTCLKNCQILDNAYGIIGIELFAAAQALDLREYAFGKGTTKAREIIRKYVDFLEIDRPLYHDHNNMKELVKQGEILHEVEKVTGILE